jgi:hypothetical protein
MDELIQRLARPVADNCRAVIDAGNPLSVEAMGGAENLVLEIHYGNPLGSMRQAAGGTWE